MPPFDLVSKQIEAYEAKHHQPPEATPAEVLPYLMEEHDLKQTGLADELGGQVLCPLSSTASANSTRAK